MCDVRGVLFLAAIRYANTVYVGITASGLRLADCPVIHDESLNVTWPSIASNNCVLSRPLCLNDKMEVAARCCDLGTWKESPCVFIQEEPPPCPENFQYDKAKELCYTSTTETEYPPQCPYGDVVPFSDYKIILDESVREPMWMPVVRDIDNNRGFFVWQEFSTNYKIIYTDEILNKSNLTNNCLIYRNKVAEAVPCSAKYKGMCVYQKLDSSGSYCLDKMKVCRRYDYTHLNKCFCVRYGVEGVRKLPSAELLLPYQNKIVTALTSDDCLIGVERQNDTYIWVNSHKPINYTNWSPLANFSYLNKYGVFTKDGWILEDNFDEIKCVIYESFVLENEPSLHLWYNDIREKFEVSIGNKDDLKEFSINSNSFVYCFSDTWITYGESNRIDVEVTKTDITFSPRIPVPGYYWCESIKYSTFQIIRSNKILFPSYPTCEYIAVILCDDCSETIDILNIVILENIRKMISNKLSSYIVRIHDILSVDMIRRQTRLNFHLTLDSAAMYNCLKSHEKLFKQLQNLTDNLKVQGLYNAYYCIHENYVGLTWPDTYIGKSAFPKELCITDEGYIIERKCLGNFTDGGRWAEIQETCTIREYSCVTRDLHDLLVSNLSSSDIITGLHNITSNHTNFISLDIFLISAILSKVSDSAADSLDKIVSITNSLNSLDKKRLTQAEVEYHATNKILKDLDHIFSQTNVSTSKSKVVINSNNTFLIANDINSNFSGVVLFKNGDQNYSSTILERVEDLARLVTNPFFEAAVVIPFELTLQIRKSNSASKIVFVVFVVDSLFNSVENKTSDEGSVRQIFDVLIPGFDEAFVKPIAIYYKTGTLKAEQSCVHWQFEREDGFWENDSISKDDGSLKKCEFWHVTHFALLFVDDPNVEDINFGHILDIITDVNCMLSLFGLLIILLTAILFKRWRTNTGNKILVNFVFAIAFQISLLYVSDSIHKYVKINDLCTIVGALLQYSIISEFCWMLIIAILQFKRFVDVLGGQPKYVILKACVIGWILPLFPVLCVLFLDPKSYVKSKVGLCYPTGLSLYLSIWLPVGIIVAINSVIFTYILYSVTTRNTECLIDSNELYYQWRLAVLLFFMLGLTWSFGLLIQLDFGTLFVYLFTCSASLQGFVMFLFFIIFNKNTRSLYLQYLRNVCIALKNK